MKIKSDETIRVLRVVQYVGKRWWVEEIVGESIHGRKTLEHGYIEGATVTAFSDYINPEEQNE